MLELGRKIQTEAQSEMEKIQRDYFLREQMKAIQRELGEGDEQAVEIEELRSRSKQAGMPEEAKQRSHARARPAGQAAAQAAEYGVIRTYLDWLISLPWNKLTDDNLDIAHARQVLDEDHYGLEGRQRAHPGIPGGAQAAGRAARPAERRQPAADDRLHPQRARRRHLVLCRPAGRGQDIAGPVHRAGAGPQVRAYVAGRRARRGRDPRPPPHLHRRDAGPHHPGPAPRRDASNPVFMLDEVDKLGVDFRGDPASALLEVLDPEQNHEFRDHYLDVPFDLSQVMFITTANQLEPIPGPLLDRMEVITLSGYTEGEKIAHRRQGYLIPRQIKENGLRAGRNQLHRRRAAHDHPQLHA